MYKQTFFAAMSILLSLPMITQQGYAANSKQEKQLMNQVERAVAQQAMSRHYLPWAEAVLKEKNQLRRNSVLEYSAYGLWTQVFRQRPVKQDQELYNMRMGMLQDKLRHHALLRGYTFKATVPEMLTNLTLDEFGFLFNFLEQSIFEEDVDPSYTPQISKPEDAVVELRFSFVNNVLLILRVDTAKQRVYFFKDKVVE